MPISKENKKLYPKNWDDLSFELRVYRAKGQCECRGECGLHKGRRCVEKHMQPARFANGKIILTVAHLDHNPQNCKRKNLKVMCQRCHLRYDQNHHLQNAAKTRRSKKAIGDLFIAAG